MISEPSRRVSTNHPSPQIGWTAPRAPLPPHRLAKLANALGVATPSPVTGFLTPGASNSGQSPSTSTADIPWRSATPSAASAHNVASSFSKYLLHVIPPLHLPHDSDTSDSDFAPPPPTASGYHIQFRRGTLVTLQSTLQAQLVVIAKEYALPSTTGIILYLVTASPQSRQNSPMPFASASLSEMGEGEPGPRLTEDIWKLIWNRVLRSEREETIARSQSPIPHRFGLGVNEGPNCQSQSLRPLATPMRSETPQLQTSAYPVTPSTSTTSSVSDLRSKSAPPFSSPSDSDTPDTSRSSSQEIPGIELPGLNSQSIIPILAKVEFDIDRRKATWYEPWLRNRRITHGNRVESRSCHRTGSRIGTGGAASSQDDKRAPFDLKLVEKMHKPAFLRSNDESDEEQPTNGEYGPLSESSDAMDSEEWVGGPGIHNNSAVERDPLTDVFGTDADTWADIHVENDVKRRTVGADVVELALDASSLSAVPQQAQNDELDEAQEVRDIMHRMSKPPLNVSIPLVSESRRRSSPMTAGGSKRPIPPPLLLTPRSPNDDVVVPSSMPSSGGESTNLPYMTGECATPSSVVHSEYSDREGLSLEMEQEYLRSRSPAEEKRVGTLFEDLDLGLDLGEDDEEYDENDPNDRRRSQYLMRAQLDEIERTLVQFSPQQLKTAVLDEDMTITHRRTLTSTSQSSARFAQPNTMVDNGSTVRSAEAFSKAWPSVPYSVGQGISNSLPPPRSASHLPSPPRLALNGVTTGAPKAFIAPPLAGPSDDISTETETRRRELEQYVYPANVPPFFTRQTNVTSDSPIPLSPDPFGRYPSVYEAEPPPAPTYWDPVTHNFSHKPSEPRPSVSSADEGSLASTTPSSRFSADSASLAMDHNDKAGKTAVPLVSVKSFKKLWRRSKSTSASQQPPTPSAGRSSFQLSGPPTQRNSHDQPAAPPVPAALSVKNGKSKAPVTLPFDQESPYPIHPGRPSMSDSRPTSPSIPLSGSTLPTTEKTSVRKSILKSWKSVSGAGSHSTTTGAQPRKGSERPVSNETIKPRRPSVLDNNIPPSPKLPDQYLPSNHARTTSGLLEHRKSASRSKMESHHSASSQDMLTLITQQQRSSVVMQGLVSTSPSRSSLSTFSQDSQIESRGSFETSQFELISPPKVHPNLSYPYQTLDHE
ncbi:hypothetical protein F5I97DRAFT_1928063 [Phlebopus sp. FC_14]|nr:hypothetical protein F5I97DRAFT_1928063 [Phlebopus sp. FC_14]